MRNRLTNNIGLKVIALVFAFLLWLAIVNVDDPVDTKQYSGVTVKAQNESLITNDGKIYQVLDNTNIVTVTVKAKRSVLKNIDRSDISASADIKNLQLDSMVPITVTIPSFEGRYEEARANPLNMRISIEDNESVKLPVTVATTGTPRDGYFVESTSVSPDNITVSGPKSKVESISAAVVTIDVSGLSADASVTGNILFYDAQNNVIDDSLLTTNVGDDGVTVSVSVLQTKSVPVKASTYGEPASGYNLVSISCEPDTLELVGSRKMLDSIDSIVIPGNLIDITNATSTVESVVNIKDYLPAGISTADEKSGKILVTAVIESYGSKTVNYPVGSIQVLNAPDGYKLTYQNTTDLNLKFQGAEENLSSLSASSLQVTIDLRNITEAGTYEQTVTVVPPSGCTLTDSVKVTVVLTKE